jgi:hypothetical protein
MAVDGANRAGLEYPASPLPAMIHRFYPRWMTYYFTTTDKKGEWK